MQSSHDVIFPIPDTLMTDNGPWFTSKEFCRFRSSWRFQHVASSQHYPQSNGKAEIAVKTIKRLRMKCAKSGQSEFRALLDWRNSPTEGMSISSAFYELPVQDTTTSLLRPRYGTKEDTEVLKQRKKRQKLFYNFITKSLPPPCPGETAYVPSWTENMVSKHLHFSG